MEHFTPKYRRNPNAMVHSAYRGVAPNGQILTKIVKEGPDGMEVTRTYEAPTLGRGESGQIAHLILGGRVTTLDEIEYMLEAKKEKKFVRRKSESEIVAMCRHLQERKNEAIKYYRKNPSEAPKPKKKVKMYLPVGYQYIDTAVPGFRVLAKV